MSSSAKQLTDLPVDVLTRIFKYASVPEQPRILAELCTICRVFRLIVTPLLYNKIIIPVVASSSELTLDPISVACFLLEGSFGVQYIRHIAIRGCWDKPGEGNDRDGGGKEQQLGVVDGAGVDTDSPDTINASLLLGRLLERIPGQRLESFKWCVTVDFSGRLMDKLVRLHPSVRVLELWEEGNRYRRGWVETIGLSKLEDISWQNISTYSYLKGIANLVSLNWQTLKSLSLGCSDLDHLLMNCYNQPSQAVGELNSLADDEQNRFTPIANMIFAGILEGHHSPGVPNPKQMKLVELLLWEFPLKYTTSIMTRAIDFLHLQRLELYRCKDVSNLLEALSRVGPSLNLKWFEIILESGYQKVGKFLRSFQGLETLFLLFEDLEDSESLGLLVHSVVRHRSSLRRLVVDAKRGRTESIYLEPKELSMLGCLNLWELGITVNPSQSLNLMLYNLHGSPSTLETLQTIHIRNLTRPLDEVAAVSKAGTPDFFRSSTFRNRKADVQRCINLDDSRSAAAQRSLRCVAVGEVEIFDVYDDKYAAEEGWTCFVVDYVDVAGVRGVPVLSPMTYRDLCALGVPCEVLSVGW